MTTYAENIGVMAVTRIYSTLVFVVAAVIALVLGFSPKFGALIQTIPGPVLGHVGRGVRPDRHRRRAHLGGQPGRFQRQPQSDRGRRDPGAGAGDFSVKLGDFSMNGIGTATFGAIILYALLGLARRR